MHGIFRSTLAVFAVVLSAMVASAAVEEAPMEVADSERITLEQAMTFWEEGVAFLDVRPAANFDEGRIPGAINLYVGEDLTEDSIGAEVSKDAPIVVYCNGEKCGLSAQAIPMLAGWGYGTLYYLREGYPGWENAGFPVE